MNSSNSHQPTLVSSSEQLIIPVLAEQMQVDVQREITGTVRVRKLVHEESAPVSTDGFRELVEMTRVPVNQVVETAESSREVGDMLVIPVYEERLVKQLVLVEEIHVRRRREAFENTASVVLRREEVVVERLNRATGQWAVDQEQSTRA